MTAADTFGWLRKSTRMDRILAEFLERNPGYEHGAVESLRAGEYPLLDRETQAYLDYTGGGLHSLSQVREHAAMLTGELLGNPHSRNPTSMASTERIEHVRHAVLDFFRADPAEYHVVFTPNASGALKHVGESYPFDAGSRLLLTYDNHNSVNGIREFARRKGASLGYVPVIDGELRLDEDALRRELASGDGCGPRLFAYPAQSNFSGVQHPLEWIDEARDAGWDVLLDSAAFVPTNRLDLARWRPDFAVVSFYKLFGFPTGVGCLLARHDAMARLRRPWFAGGTITIASVQGDGYFHHDNEAAFEDGTLDYLNLPAVGAGLRHVERVGIDTIHERVRALCGWLLGSLAGLRHSNGRPLVRILGPCDTRMRGGTISMMLHDPDGAAFDERRIEILAGQAGISLRTGCFCNPGAGEIAHHLSEKEMRAFFREGGRVSFEQLRETVRHGYGKSVASIRISLGIASNFADVRRFVDFARVLLDRSAAEIGQEECHECRIVREDP